MICPDVRMPSELGSVPVLFEADTDTHGSLLVPQLGHFPSASHQDHLGQVPGPLVLSKGGPVQ